MSTSATDNFISAARSRRLACNRCHRHKLRCERSPIMVNGSIAIPLGTCKRCQKAQVACQTTNGTYIPSGGDSLTNATAASKKSAENISPARPPAIPNTSTGAATPNIPNHEDSMLDSPLFSGDDANALLDLGNFDFDTSDFGQTNEHSAVSAALSTSPSLSSHTWENYNDDPKHSSRMLSESFVDSAYFGSTPRLNGSSVSSHTTVNSDDSKMVLQQDPINPRDSFRLKLLELNSLLFSDLQCITDVELAEALFSFEGTSFSSRDRPGPDGNLVHRVLFASERLIELLSTAGAVHLPQACQNSSYVVKLPVIISVLTCYVGLLSVYHAIFTHIHDALSALEPTLHDSNIQKQQQYQQQQRNKGWLVPHSTAPGVLAVPEPERPVLRHEDALKIRVQMEVMTHMLERVDDAWAASLVDETQGNGEIRHLSDGKGVFGRASTTSLLHNMLIHEGYEVTDDDSIMGLVLVCVSYEAIAA
ncbi:uncharacterized protein TRIVIDRAFT_68779 [Trichoderma virens Gv29-8]|uniref:Zn(2)-C6 fungal-type domain-containing protein n=1 Tax=Hypocrea virens (strain Gv29-8 / FGSC 10586) TaxID=413071 RepID=G9N010_HYPVG|nr:uncharacterized protein TRIVIDRAFT_68779 [Trichoderma virens Gv29-8]EHK20214.1 hypothetical protein TRIVIDRAFT_68779 [Trichoderma virens Gv29-8]UKZ45847.1 hypothetical protein TrVGV298_000040 [Trichoderma virens]UKZ72405.1 hypothetical protein TrVFT333_000034 [Trichoderma virens FT-333]